MSGYEDQTWKKVLIKQNFRKDDLYERKLTNQRKKLSPGIRIRIHLTKFGSGFETLGFTMSLPNSLSLSDYGPIISLVRNITE